MNPRQTIIGGSLLGLLGVALGAFGAHALKGLLVENGRVETYELAVRYQFYHAITLLIFGSLPEKFGSSMLRWASLFIFTGIILFSGSLYGFALTKVTGFALVTPLGGVLMLIGWGAFTYSLLSKTKS
jgi:uncharacterized membrane protein YgdD (TMEM256/DUF423 family)